MRRAIASLRPLWGGLMGLLLLLVAVEVILGLVPGLPPLRLEPGYLLPLVGFSALLALTLLCNVAPRPSHREPVELESPVRGEWVAMNSPGQRLPSHGTLTRGQFSAVDVCTPAGARTPPLVHGGLLGDRPERYGAFGRPIRSMAAGVVIRVRDGQRDHRARSTWPALLWMMTGEAMLREIGGTRKVLGNHVVVDHGDGTFAAYAHVRRGTAAVREGDRVAAGQVLAEVGNTGNSSMPHLHVQLMDRARTDAASGIPMRWRGIEPTGRLDPVFAQYAKEPAASALAGMPRNGEVFTAPPEPEAG